MDLNVSPRVGYRIELGGDTAVEPYAGLALIYRVISLDANIPDLGFGDTGVTDSDTEFAAALQVGADFQLTKSLSGGLQMDLGLSGDLQPDLILGFGLTYGFGA